MALSHDLLTTDVNTCCAHMLICTGTRIRCSYNFSLLKNINIIMMLTCTIIIAIHNLKHVEQVHMNIIRVYNEYTCTALSFTVTK